MFWSNSERRLTFEDLEAPQSPWDVWVVGADQLYVFLLGVAASTACYVVLTVGGRNGARLQGQRVAKSIFSIHQHQQLDMYIISIAY